MRWSPVVGEQKSQKKFFLSTRFATCKFFVKKIDKTFFLCKYSESFGNFSKTLEIDKMTTDLTAEATHWLASQNKRTQAKLDRARELLAQDGAKQADVKKKAKLSNYVYKKAVLHGLLPRLRETTLGPKTKRGPRPRLVNLAVSDTPASDDGQVTVVVIKGPATRLASILSQI